MTKKLTKEEKEANKAARRARKAAEGKPAKKSKKASKVVAIKAAKKPRGGIGHNKGQENEELKEIFAEYHKLDEDKKAISRAQRDLRAKAKESHGVSKENFNHEVKLQKWENDRRVMFETGAADLKGMLGIQLAMNLESPDDDAEDGIDVPDPLDAAREASAVH